MIQGGEEALKPFISLQLHQLLKSKICKKIMCLIIFMVTLIGYTEGQPLYNDIGNDLSVDTTQACYKECYGKS